MNRALGYCIFFAILFISGCAAPGPRPSIVDGHEITDGHGLLAVALESNWPSIKFDYQEDLHLRVADGVVLHNLSILGFEQKKYVAVIELPADDYEFYDLVIANLWWDLDSAQFTIRENAVTYIGDIEVTIHRRVYEGLRDPAHSAAINVEARPDALRKYLDQSYPQSLRNLEIYDQVTPITVK
jgi:hypothetical protein